MNTRPRLSKPLKATEGSLTHSRKPFACETAILYPETQGIATYHAVALANLLKALVELKAQRPTILSILELGQTPCAPISDKGTHTRKRILPSYLI